MESLSCPKQTSSPPLHAISAALHNSLCTPTCLPFRDRSKQFSSHLQNAKVPHQECIHHWVIDGTFHLLLLIDRSSIEMCSLQLLCQSPFSPIQTIQDCSWHQDQNFLHVTVSLQSFRTFDSSHHAIRVNSNRHSIQRNSNCHHEGLSVQNHELLSFSFKCFVPWTPFDFPFGFSFVVLAFPFALGS